GVLSQNIMEIEIRCLATEVPDAVHVEVAGLEVGDSIHVANLDLPALEVLTNPDITVVSVQAPKAEVIVEEVEEELEEVEEEGEEAEGAEAPPEEPKKGEVGQEGKDSSG
ncbi:MAG: hypothetical protein ACE5GH_01565, partial [Fidelibacterota bacterium]